MSTAEREYFYNSQHFAFRVKQLYKKDRHLFNQMVDYFPNAIFLNDKESLKISFATKELFTKGAEMEGVVKKGLGYVKKISCPVLYNRALGRAKLFNKLNDKEAIFPYLQNLKMNGEMKYFYANKIILDDQLYLNSGFFTEDMGLVGKATELIFKPIKNSEEMWLRFQSLTKREKQILKLLANGNSNKEISDLLFISSYSVHTHRKNIYKKLDIHKTSQLVQFALLLEII